MNRLDIAREARDRCFATSELLNQLLGIQSFEDQELLLPKEAHDEAVRLISQFLVEIKGVARLLEQYLEARQIHRH
jgi:hypothetical protein